MKIIRSIAATFALCGTAFFTNMVHAGDCGYWETQGYWSTSNVSLGASGVSPPATGPGTSTFITTGATFVPQSCGGAPEDDGNPLVPGTVGLIKFSDADCLEIAAGCETSCNNKGEKAKALCGAFGDLKELGNTVVAFCTFLAIDWTQSCVSSCKKVGKECIDRNRMV